MKALLDLLNSKFKGKKTYTTAAVAVLTAAISYLSGEATLIQALQLAVTGAMGATLRHGLSTELLNAMVEAAVAAATKKKK